MQKATKKVTYRLRLVAASLLLLGAQALAPVSAFLPTASAAALCTNDQQGANDEPGQKDLTQMCSDGAGLPTSVAISWQWDETSWSGNNTGDGCALFDSDGDGKANYAFCVTIGGNPAAQLPGSPKVYSCNDSKSDRCSGKQLVNKAYTSTCSVTVSSTDPFAGGTNAPNDTRANCTINLSDLSTSQAPQSIVLQDVCSYPSQEPNSDPSDCIIAGSNKTTTIEVVKNVAPDSDSGTFDLFVNSTKYVDDGPDGSTTGAIAISDKSDVTVKEMAGSNAALNDYTTTVSCVNQAGSSVSLFDTVLTGTERKTSIDSSNIAEGDNIICTFTNTRQQATLILQKTVTNDNGGTLTQANFPVAINGNTAQWGSNTVSPGDYTVSETQQTGYAAGAWGGDCDAQGNVSLANGQTKTCTITNDDVTAQMKVVKTVVTDNGGSAVPADFTLYINGQAKTQGQYFDVDAGGPYTVTETGPNGYAQTNLVCLDDRTQQTVVHPVTLALGQSVTCMVTNDDVQPLLTVTKVVINNNGGTAVVTDFPLFVGASGVTSGVQNGFNAGGYVVSETNQTGYAATISGDCDANGNVTLSVGDIKACTITNNDIAPLLTVIKYVINDDGGLLNVSDFTLYVDGNQVTSGVPNVLDAGDHTVSEANKTGYTAGTWGGDCATDGTITLLIGDSKTCTITNNDQPGTLVVKKVVVNDNGGKAEADDFSFSVNGGGTMGFEADGQNNLTVPAGTYSVVEVAASGYATTYDNCDGVQVANGETETCTITNNDVSPQLTVTKHVINNNGGTKAAPDFTMLVSGANVSDADFPGDENGTTVTLNAGDYSVSENGVAGYTAGYSANCAGSIGLGEHKYCTVTNDDNVPVLILIKQVVNSFGGTADEDDWLLKADGPTDIYGWGGASSDSSFKAGTYTLSEWGFPQGYSASDWECVGGSQNSNQITLGLGEHAACTVTNYDNPAKITVTKEVINDNGGHADADDFKLWVDNTRVLSGVTNNFDGNDWYFVKETDGPDGYKQTSLKCYDTTGRYPVFVANPFYAKLGHSYECTIKNDDIAPKLKIVKDSQPDSIQVFDFTLKGNNTYKTFKLNDNGTSYPVDNDKTFHLDKGWYSVTEDATDGWYLDSIQCYGTHEFTDLDKGKVVVKLNLGDDVTCKFTNKKFGEIKGFKFEDVNKNGQFDQSEPLLSGWTITVEKLHDSFADSTVTGQNGWYKFDDLKEGLYKVCEVKQNGWVQTKPASNDGCETVWIHPGDHDFVKFGNFKLGQVTGVKFNDINGNGVRDNGEPTLKDWTITLTNICDEEDQPEVSLDQVLSVASHPVCKEVTKPTKTDATGAYSFDDLDVGTYVVCEVQQNNWTQTAPKTKDGCVEFTIDTSGQEEVVDFGNKAKPQVLGETTELVNTGASTSKGLLVGLSILGALGALHLMVRRKSYTN